MVWVVDIFKENKGPFILCSHFHGRWCSAQETSQDINDHGIDLVLRE